MHVTPPEFIAEVVRHNTGNGQPESMDPVRIKLIAVAHGPIALDEFDDALDESVAAGLLVETDGRYAPNQ